MTLTSTTPAQVRSDAARRLLEQLEVFVAGYRGPLDRDDPRLGQDAERITAEVARYLATARAANAAVPVPR